MVPKIARTTWIALSTIIFLQLALMVTAGWHWQFDEVAVEWFQHHHTGWIDVFMRFMTFLGDGWTVTGVVLAGCLLLRYRHRNYQAAQTLILVCGAAILNILAKALFDRVRPDTLYALQQHSSSFPSGHSMASAALAAAVIVIAWPGRWRWPVTSAAVSFALLVGFSRLYLGAHYPSDIIAGWCLVLIWAWLCLKTLGYLRHQRYI
jgi:membrane-associated phospholipid phosphatase